MATPILNTARFGRASDQPILATKDQVRAYTIRSLNLDADLLDLDAPEALAALVRRAASFVAPCSPRTLRESAVRVLRGLAIPAAREEGASDSAWAELRERIDAAVESLVSYGDLLELPSQDGDRGRVFYLAPPTFVRVSSSTCFLIGGRPDAVDILPSELRSRVEYVTHTRRLIESTGENLTDRLLGYGLIELPADLWFSPPRRETPAAAVDRAAKVLATKHSRGEVAGLLLLDPTTPPTYYRGRWRPPRREHGRFVARREQSYGADLWCYVELKDGEVTHLVDFPMDTRTPDTRGCDEAWQLQMAIDATNGGAQRFRWRPSPPSGAIIVDLFSPVPRWVRRKFDALGEEVAPLRSLMSYRFPDAITAAIDQCLRNELWLSEVSTR